eukprot:228815_1
MFSVSKRYNLKHCFILIMIFSIASWLMFLSDGILISLNAFMHSTYQISENAIKTSWIIHDFGTYLIQNIITLSNNSYINETVFFIHIPRTALDTTRMTMFGDSKSSIIDYSKWNIEYAPFQNININHTQWNNAKIVKGFLSWNQITKYNGNKKICIFLRHPIERIISLYKLLNQPFRLKTLFRINKPLSLIEFLTNDNKRIQSF